MLLGSQEQLLSAAHIKFVEHVARVMANRCGAYQEPAGNFFVG